MEYKRAFNKAFEEVKDKRAKAVEVASVGQQRVMFSLNVVAHIGTSSPH